LFPDIDKFCGCKNKKKSRFFSTNPQKHKKRFDKNRPGFIRIRSSGTFSGRMEKNEIPQGKGKSNFLNFAEIKNARYVQDKQLRRA
jgi:hypothetical protein